MTSSLVGSEMCIRDSWICVCVLGENDPETKKLYDKLTSLLHNLPASATVSYTHLTLPTICSV
eukprot:8940620-Prorocentrum_lima.AAC.1